MAVNESIDLSPTDRQSVMLPLHQFTMFGGQTKVRTWISGFSVRHIDQLCYLSILEHTAGFEPAINRFAVCHLRPLGHVCLWLAHRDLNSKLPGYEPGALTIELWAYNGSSDRTRTCNPPVNSRVLYPLSYRRI